MKHRWDLAVLIAGAWCGLLTGLLEGAAFARFPALRNPDLPWIAVLFDFSLFVLLGSGFALLARFLTRQRLVAAVANFSFFLLMFYDCATVGVGDHFRRVLMRLGALAVAAAMTLIVAKFAIPWARLQRRTLVWLALFALLYTGIPPVRRILQEHRALAQVSASNHSPNVLVIVVDTLRADHLSAYGYKRQTSPHLSDLARQGVLFENAIAPSSWTAPSHASLLTARLPHEHEVDRGGSSLDGRFPTLAEAFRSRGYRTAAFSANWWNFARRLGFGRGFMRFEDFDSITSAIAQTNMGERVQNLLLKLHLLHSSIGHSRSADIDRDVLKWIDSSQGPFFIVANYMDVHQPYLPSLDCLHRFSRLARPPGGRFFGNPRPAYLTPARVQDEVDAYDASVYCMDQQVGLLQRELTRRGLMGNTILVLTSDHGEGFDEHHLMSHGNSLYRELIHVPLIMAGHGVPAGITVQRPVSLMWLPTTLLTLSGGGAGPFPGVAMEQAWNSAQPPDWPDPVSELKSMHMDPAAPNYSSDLQSIVTPEWHLIRKGKSAAELYRFDSDAREANNLAAANSAVAQVLKAQLQKEETGQMLSTGAAAGPAPTPPAPAHAAAADSGDGDQEPDWKKTNDYLKALGYAPR